MAPIEALMMASRFTRLMLAFVLVSAAGCAGGPRQRPVEMGPVDQGAGSLTTARQFLEGRWTLESFEIHPAGKPPITPKGAGSLTYDKFGNLRMEIRADRDAVDTLRAAGIDIRDGVIATDGRAAIDMQNKTLTYMIQSQSAAAGTGPLATNRPRHWQVEADVLTLTTKDEAGNPASVSRWRRMK
jgi:hypothetical protein